MNTTMPLSCLSCLLFVNLLLFPSIHTPTVLMQLRIQRHAYVFASTKKEAGDEAWMEDLFKKIPGDYHIGLVVGDSGSGKSVFLRKYFTPPQVLCVGVR